MVLAALSSARRRITEPLPERPYNADTYAVTPTADGSGSTVHPDVIDFASILPGGQWQGWRYWMAVTGYYLTNDDLENPHILVSDDGQTWQAPDGLTNPVYPMPTAPAYNSDTDLAYDAATDEIVMIYRGGSRRPRIARSADGVTWPGSATELFSISYSGEILSPALVYLAPSDWLLYAVAGSGGSRQVYRWTSTDTITWTGPSAVAGISGMAAEPWHLDVIRHAGRYWMLVNSYEPDFLYAASSLDGLEWSLNTTPVISPLTALDNQWIYRATLQPHESGDRFRVWYSAMGSASWRTFYTQIPKSEWPAPSTP